MNPWGLTNAQCEALAALVKHGTNQGAAIELRLSENGMHSRLRAACGRMGVEHKLHAVLAWDRWCRQQEGERS